MARMVLVEAASLGPTCANKRRDVLGGFAALVRAISTSGSPWNASHRRTPAASAWRGALDEAVMPSLQRELPALAGPATALSALLPRSGAQEAAHSEVIHLSTVIHRARSAASGAGAHRRRAAEPR
jgi:hypothetical protein